MTDLRVAPPSQSGRVAWPVAVIGFLSAATVAVSLRDPHRDGSWGLCPSAELGVWCPGCGALRAVNDLTHLRLGDALSSNLLLVVVLPLATFFLGRWALDSWTGRERETWRHGNLVVAVLLTSLLVFTVLRNLPGFVWLAP